MRALRVATIIFLSLLLFVALNVLGVGLLMHNTVLNPDFITGELDNLDMPALTQDILSETGDQPAPGEALPCLIASAVAKVEPQVKAQLKIAIYPVYNFLRGESQQLDLTLEPAWAEISAHLRAMSPYEFQDLVAALVEAMGYHVAWVAPPGPDRGIDIIAGLIASAKTAARTGRSLPSWKSIPSPWWTGSWSRWTA